jgi:hypothetical protein
MKMQTRRRRAKGIFTSEEQRQTDIIDSHRYRRDVDMKEWETDRG